MKLRITSGVTIVLMVATMLGLVAYAGQKNTRTRTVPHARQAGAAAEPRIELRLAQLKQWLDQRPSGMSPETKAEILEGHRKRLTEYRGTEINPSQDVEGDALEFQKKLAGVFHRLDLQPPQRLNHFQWCLQPDLVHVGWYGGIKEVAKGPDGWLVKIAVSPRLESLGPATAVFTPDKLIEYYRYSPAGLVFLKAEETPVDHRGTIFYD